MSIWPGPSSHLGSSRLHPIVWIGVVGWSVFVVVTLSWLFRGNDGPIVTIIQDGNSPKPHDFFSAEFGLQRVYPWLLLGPYVVLIAGLFPLERGRFRLHLPLNLAACVAFVTISHMINTRARLMFSHITLIKSGANSTNTVQVQFLRTDQDNLFLNEFVRGTIVEGRHSGSNLWPDNIQIPSAVEASNRLFSLPGFKFPPAPLVRRRLDLWPTLLDLMAYGTLFGLTHSVHFYRRFREREHRALFLESSLSKARLSTLRAQLQPHFLFNSLNAIAALLRRDPRLAESALMSLSELLRLALKQSERQQVTLDEELEFVERYLEIQQTRFGDKLRVERDLEPGSLDCLVPTLILQPLIENAIRHGIEPAEKNCVVRFTTCRRDGKLVLIVEDDGVGLRAPATDFGKPQGMGDPTLSDLPKNGIPAFLPISGGTGIGLSNLQARLETLYGSRQKLSIASRDEGGVRVLVEIPWHIERSDKITFP